VIIISEKHNLICPSFYIPRRLHLFRSRIFLRFYNLISPSFHIPRRLHGFRSSPFSGFPPDYKSSSPALPHLLRIFAGSPLSRYISSSNKYRHFSVSQTEKRKKTVPPFKTPKPPHRWPWTPRRWAPVETRCSRSVPTGRSGVCATSTTRRWATTTTGRGTR
jgi:hypothetical protein